MEEAVATFDPAERFRERNPEVVFCQVRYDLQRMLECAQVTEGFDAVYDLLKLQPTGTEPGQLKDNGSGNLFQVSIDGADRQICLRSYGKGWFISLVEG